jgi:flagellar basal body-associated protein FliL
MSSEKKKIFSILSFFAFFGLFFSMIVPIWFGGTPVAFVDFIIFFLLLSIGFLLLFISYGWDFLRFVPLSIAAFFSNNRVPDPLFARIAKTGSRYFLATGTVGMLLGFIYVLRNLANPVMIGCGVTFSFLSIFYSLLISEFYFVSACKIFKEAGEDEEQGRIHFYIPALLLMLVLTFFFLLMTDFKALESGEDAPTDNNFVLEGTELEMSPIICNVSGTNGKKTVKILPVIDVNSPDIYKYFCHKSKYSPDGMHNEIKERLTDIISEKPLKFLLGKGAKEKLSDEFKKELNDILEEKRARGIVRKVYFTEYLIQ